MKNDIEIRLRKLLKKLFDGILDLDGIELNDNLGSKGINSVSFIKLAVAIECEFDFEFDDAYLNFARFDTLQNVIDYIESKLEQGE